MSVEFRLSTATLKSVAGLVLFALIAAPPARAETAEELQQIEQSLAQQKQEAEALEQREQATTQDLDLLKGQLITATEALQDKQEEQDRLEDSLAELEQKVSNRSGTLGASRARLVQLTSALTQLSLQPPESFLLRDAPTEDHVHRAILLRTLLPRLQAETEGLTNELGDLEATLQTLTEKKRIVAAARQNLAWQRSNLDQLMRTRQGLLQKTAAQKAAIAKQLEALAAEAKDLRQLMEKVSRPVAPKGAQRLRAGLRLPVAGRITRTFGAKDEAGVSSQGLTLTAAPDSPVVAPRDGRVVFAGPFRGYGQIVILQHGDGYHSFLSGFGRIDADMGQNVAAGEPLGVLPSGGSARPELYFEWRHNGDPLDPMANGATQHANAP